LQQHQIQTDARTAVQVNIQKKVQKLAALLKNVQLDSILLKMQLQQQLMVVQTVVQVSGLE